VLHSLRCFSNNFLFVLGSVLLKQQQLPIDASGSFPNKNQNQKRNSSRIIATGTDTSMYRTIVDRSVMDIALPLLARLGTASATVPTVVYVQ
jgi:hypothetical protein